MASSANVVTAAPLGDVRRELAERAQPVLASPADALHAVDHAHATLESALRGAARSDAYDRLISAAAALLGTIANLPVHAAADTRDAGLSQQLADELAVRLDRFEQWVIEGERSYEIAPAEAHECVAVAQTAIAEMTEGRADSWLLFEALRLAALELAALLVRAAGNIASEGRAQDATLTYPLATARAVKSTVADIVAAAESSRLSEPPDLVASCERLAGEVAEMGWTSDKAGLRARWLQLASLEFAAASGLERARGAPDTTQGRDSRRDVLTRGALEVLCTSRLIERPDQFPLGSAGRHQVTALARAREALDAARRGHSDASDLARLIVLTRLTRAIAVLALIEMGHSSVEVEGPYESS